MRTSGKHSLALIYFFSQKIFILFCYGRGGSVTSIVVLTTLQFRKFLKFLPTNLLSKVAQMFGDFWSNLEHHQFLSQTTVTNFWAIFNKNWATFHSAIWSHWSGILTLSRPNCSMKNENRKQRACDKLVLLFQLRTTWGIVEDIPDQNLRYNRES